ncbi:MAG TPA: RNA-binding protein [bacterium]|nr:RNA-binding protein [bacterium]
MNNKLYIGNLPYQTSEEELKQLFSQAGTVSSARVITEGASGRSKGFGFVEMETAEQAAAAIEQLNGTELLGRALTVAEARPPKGGDRGPRERESGTDE